jgi:mRNA interferase RelE/StbE
MYQIYFTEKAEKQLKKLEKDDQERILKALERIRIRPESFVTKLIGDEGYKLRVADYRVILDIVEDKLIILMLMVGHKKNIYDSL